jgi:hypothetical protein
VSAVQAAANHAVVRIPSRSLKPFWSDELDRMKEDCNFWYHLWASSGRPGTGWLQSIKNSCKLKYKSAIRNAYIQYEHTLDDDLCQHYIAKNMPDFWKVWSCKFKRNITNNVQFPGCTSNVEIANAFA